MAKYSNSIRTIPIHSDICIRANANHSEPIRKTFCISFDKKRSKLIRTNPKPSFQSESIRAWVHLNRIFNQNQSE